MSVFFFLHVAIKNSLKKWVKITKRGKLSCDALLSYSFGLDVTVFFSGTIVTQIITHEKEVRTFFFSPQGGGGRGVVWCMPVSYTHLTLPTI